METLKIRAISILLFILTLLVPGIAQEHKLIKQVGVSYHGVTDTIDLMPILVNVNGNVVVSGNQKMNATQYDATTIEQLTSGATSWINQYNPSNQKAFITANCKDNAGNIYTAGAIRTNTTNGIDYLVMKIDMSGTLQWVYTYNGTNSTNDVASAICVDPGGNVYVTGASDGSGFTLIDYATIAIDPNGTQLWCMRYDNANSMDIPTGIAYDAAINRVYVSGASGNNLTDYDFYTISYDAPSGNPQDAYRTGNSAGVGQDKAFGMATDSNGNLYVTGTTFNGTNYDLQLVKLDTALNQVYVKTFDGHGYDDAGIAVQVDQNNNVIVVGSSYLSNGSRELVTLLYNPNGSLVWKFQRQRQPGQDAEGLRLKIKSSNEYFIGGNYGAGSSQDIVLLCLDSLGKMRIEKTFDGSGFRDRIMDFTMDGNTIYVSARTTTAAAATVENNITIKYVYETFNPSVVTVGSGPTAQRYIDKDVIIMFNKKVLKMNAINDLEMPFGRLAEYVADSTIAKIELALDPERRREISGKDIPVKKIFFDLTEKDSLSLSRTGQYVKVPPFYCALLIKLPSWYNTTNAITPLNSNSVKPDIIYSQLNNVFQLASPPPPPGANDPSFAAGQLGLSASHANVDSAWAITSGTPSIRVGFMDSGIEPGHPDLPASIGGFDFVGNTALANGDADDHGTPVSGVVAAIRNNSNGSAGIAGGDDSNSQPGATIFDLRCTNGGFPPETAVAAALLKGSQGSNLGGFACHILNAGFFYGGAYNINNWGHGVAQLTIDNLNFASRNGVALCFPKANFNNLGTQIFPADWSDDIIMSCGSSGTDGHHCVFPTNCTNASTTWGQIDFLAPGTGQLIKTTSNQLTTVSEDGTSHATPHVSGITALIMGYRNQPTPNWNNLVHEDIEHILQRTATDLVSGTYNEGAGYDTVSGWGRVNAYRAMRELNKNYYRVHHVSETIGSTSTSGALTSMVFTDTMTWTNYPGVPTGTYVTEIYKRTVIINYSLLPSEKIIDKWPLNKECYGVKFDSTFVDGDRPYYGRIDSLSATACTMSTFYYKIPTLNVFMPYSSSQIKSAFTVYTYDSTGTVGIKEYPDAVNFVRFKVFPNPNSGQFVVEFVSDINDNLDYKVTNVLGQEVYRGQYKAGLGVNKMQINTPELSNGIYILSIFNKNKELHKQKIIKE